MSGVRLLSLDSPDLLDVLHYMYEQDLFEASQELQEAKDKSRVLIYETLYERDYPYGSSLTKAPNYDDLPFGEEDMDDMPVPLNPKAISSRPKAYVPATAFNPNSPNPYDGVLDAPMG